MRFSKRSMSAAAVVGGLAALWAGCTMMPAKEPIPGELAIVFTASTGGEIEPCG